MENGELIDAVKKGEANRVAALLDEDRSLLQAKEGNTSAILLAVYYGHPEIARLFVDRGARLSFFEACALGERARVQELVEQDSGLLHSFSEDGYPPVGLAIFFRHPVVARELIERGADVNAQARNPQRVAPIHAAVAVGDRATIQLLLERGADPNARQQEGFTAFHSAASHGDIELAKLLIKHGADAHARTDDGKDAAEIAEKHGHPGFTEWFRNNC